MRNTWRRRRGKVRVIVTGVKTGRIASDIRFRQTAQAPGTRHSALSECTETSDRLTIDNSQPTIDNSHTEMQCLDLTLATPAENLALDEALVDEADADSYVGETLRLWEPPLPMVVLGRSSKLADEVLVDACRARGIPVFRRASGGAAIVTGPGCLMYALILSLRERPALRIIENAHRLVLETLVDALRTKSGNLRRQGISDLALGERKCSGNSLRIKRDHLLYHGTLLYDFPLALIDECLAMPPRRPTYRCDRPHHAFVANLPVAGAALRRAVIDAWNSWQPRADWPRSRTARLAAESYRPIDIPHR